MKGVILAAGYATRFLPASKTIPKEMFPLIDRPAIDFIVQEMVDSGIHDILLVSSRRKKVMEDYFDREIELSSEFSKSNEIEKLEVIKPIHGLIIFSFSILICLYKSTHHTPQTKNPTNVGLDDIFF